MLNFISFVLDLVMGTSKSYFALDLVMRVSCATLEPALPKTTPSTPQDAKQMQCRHDGNVVVDVFYDSEELALRERFVGEGLTGFLVSV